MITRLYDGENLTKTSFFSEQTQSQLIVQCTLVNSRHIRSRFPPKVQSQWSLRGNRTNNTTDRAFKSLSDQLPDVASLREPEFNGHKRFITLKLAKRNTSLEAGFQSQVVAMAAIDLVENGRNGCYALRTFWLTPEGQLLYGLLTVF